MAEPLCNCNWSNASAQCRPIPIKRIAGLEVSNTERMQVLRQRARLARRRNHGMVFILRLVQKERLKQTEFNSWIWALQVCRVITG